MTPVLAVCLPLFLLVCAIYQALCLWLPESPEIPQHSDANVSLELEERSRDGK